MQNRLVHHLVLVSTKLCFALPKRTSVQNNFVNLDLYVIVSIMTRKKRGLNLYLRLAYLILLGDYILHCGLLNITKSGTVWDIELRVVEWYYGTKRLGQKSAL